MSDILNNIAGAISTTLTTAITGFKVYTYEPRDVEPATAGGSTGGVAATVLGPTKILRGPPDTGESQLGSDDWHTTWLVRLYVQMDDPKTAQEDMRLLVSKMIAALDANQTLGLAGTLDAVIEEVAEPEFTTSEAGRQLARYPCTVSVWSLV